MASNSIGIGVDEAADSGIIISALEVVESCLGVVDIATVAEGVQGAEGCGQSAGCGDRITPGVVGIGGYGCSAASRIDTTSPCKLVT